MTYNKNTLKKLSGSIKARLIKNWSLIIILLSVLAVGLYFVPAYKYQINPDGVSYVTIAEKYSNGDFVHALNGYWGPLLSVLDAPFFWFNMPGIEGIKIIQVLASVGISLISYLILRQLAAKRFIALFGALITGFMSLDWGLAGPITSDLLASMFTLSLLYLFLASAKSGLTIRRQALIGLSGALLYYSKSVGFFIFISSWALWIIAEWAKNKSSLKAFLSVIRLRLLSLVIFVALIAPFVALISIKYDGLTIGTSGSYNFSLVGPKTVGHPMLNQLLAPPNITASSVWEDISRAPVVHWSPFESSSNFHFFYQLVHNNLAESYHIIVANYAVLMMFGLFYILSKKQSSEERVFSFLAGGISLLVILAYAPMFVYIRYFIFVILASVLAFVALGSTWYKQKNHLLVILFFVMGGLIGGWPIWHIHKNMDNGKDLYLTASTLKPYLPAGSKVAGDNFDIQYVCFYTKTQCYGTLNPEATDALAQVNTYKVQYLLILPESVPKLALNNVNVTPIPGANYFGRYLYKIDY